jgi:iron(III) transport system substrate-binding protein
LRSTAVATPVKLGAILVAVAIVIGGAYYFYYLAAPRTQQVTLKVYGSVKTQDMQAVLKDFQGNYSYITVVYQEYTPPQAFSKITAELAAHNSTADVVFITNSLMNSLKSAGDLVSYNSSQSVNYPANYHDPKGFFATAVLLPVVFSYNTQLVTSANLPKTIDDLTNPSWKGKVIMFDITIGSTGTQYMLSLVPILGNATFTTWAKALATNVQPTLSADTTAIADDVAAGQYSIGIVTYLHDVVKLQSEGAPIGWFLPQGIPLLTAPSSLGIVKGTSHLSEAELFEDFILSKNAQQVIGNTAVRFVAYPGLAVKYTISAVAPNETVIFFPTPQVSSQARTFGSIFKSWGY